MFFAFKGGRIHYTISGRGSVIVLLQGSLESSEAIEKRKREIAIVLAGKKDLMYPENVARMFAKTIRDFVDNLA